MLALKGTREITFGFAGIVERMVRDRVELAFIKYFMASQKRILGL
jgi:hypothetical protein